MTVIYFTATGNSLAVAKHIAGRCISAVALLQQTGPIELSDPEGIGFVMPVYFGQIPAVITQLMRRVSLRAPYLFAVLTYGELAGRAATHMRRLGEETGIRFDYIRSIKMVDNNFTIVSVSRQVRDCGRKKIPACMDAIAGEIRARKCFVEKPGVVSRLIGIIEERMPQGSKFDSGFSVEADKCNGCGTCVRVCPNANVKLTGGHPQWQGDCLKCTACYHNCPHGAVRYRKERSRYCFRNPAVTLQEIIHANNRTR